MEQVPKAVKDVYKRQGQGVLLPHRQQVDISLLGPVKAVALGTAQAAGDLPQRPAAEGTAAVSYTHLSPQSAWGV